ncbi:MAG: helix-turn-helix domain-containing protein [Saprospiraceae bacterium]
MQDAIARSELEKKRLISSIANEIDTMKTNLLNRIAEMPDDDYASLTEFVSPKKAAELLRVSLPTLYRYAEQGILNRYRVGNKTYYQKDELRNSFQLIINKNGGFIHE